MTSTRTEQDIHDLLSLPKTLVVLEQKIQKLAMELGNQEFRELSGTTGMYLGTLTIYLNSHTGFRRI